MLLAVPAAAAAKEVKAGIISDNPLATVDAPSGTISGVIGETVDMVLRRSGYRPEYQALPATRAYMMVENGDVDLILTAFKTPERTAAARYSAPIMTEFTILAVPKGKGFALHSLAGLKGKTIGGRGGFLYPTLDRSEGVVIERNVSTEANLRKLLAGRLDAVVVGSISGTFELRQLGLVDKIEFLPVAIDPLPLGVAFSTRSFSAADVAAFDKDVAALQTTPQWAAILKRHGAEGLARPWPLVGP